MVPVLKNSLRHLLRTLFPVNIAELLLLMICVSAYGALAAFIAIHYTIVFDDRIPWDAYFSFDNRSIVLTGGGYERHPLSKYFFDVLRGIALFFSNGQKNEIFRLTLALSSAVAVSLSVLQIFKYLRNICKLNIWKSCLLAFFFAIFSTNILLSFTPETYTYTLLALCVFKYWAASRLSQNKPVSAASLMIGSVAIGGLTITNIVKVFIPVFFEHELFSRFKNIRRAIIKMAVAVLPFVFLVLYRIDFKLSALVTKTGEQYEKFSQPKVTPLWDMISSWFLGAPVLFPGFVMRDYHNKTGFHYQALFMETYKSALPYGAVFLLFLLMICSVFINRKNKLVWLLVVSFTLDVLIHCILKFGLHTAYIYGGHFVFVYPLLIGWLLANNLMKNKFPVLNFAVIGLIILLAVYTASANIFRMSEFFEFLNLHYRS